MIYNLLTCAEMIIIAFAQSQAFNWTQFQGEVNKAAKLQRDCCLITAFKILFATTDVLDDAHNTFLGDANDSEGEKET